MLANGRNRVVTAFSGVIGNKIAANSTEASRTRITQATAKVTFMIDWGVVESELHELALRVACCQARSTCGRSNPFLNRAVFLCYLHVSRIRLVPCNLEL